MEFRTIDRRAAIGFLAICAGAQVFSSSTSAFAAAQRRPVATPKGEWILTRVVERGLGKGVKIVVTRRWMIHFSATATGITVTGHQLSATVDAPAKLSAIADIERKRDASDMFPIELDRTGLITNLTDASNPKSVAEAVATALRQLKQRGDKGQSYADHRSFLLSVNRMSAEQVSRIPTDLFFPAPGSKKTDRTIPLAEGQTGKIAIFHTATTRQKSPLLGSSERRIVTTVGAEDRVSSETWTLSPSP